MKVSEQLYSRLPAQGRVVPWALKVLTVLPVVLVLMLIAKFRVHFWQLDCQRIIKIVTDTSWDVGSWLHWLDHVNGHRLPVTMALYGIVGGLTRWNGTAWIVVTLVLAAGCLAAFRMITRETVSCPLKRSWLLMIGAWVFFSPLRVSNWMMSWGIMWPLLELFLFGGIAVAVSHRFSWRTRNTLCVVFALLGSHTLLHGLLLWGVFPAALFGAAVGEQKSLSWKWWLCWLGAGLLVGASYFNFGMTTIKTWGDAESSVPSLVAGVVGNSFAILRFGFQLVTGFGTPIGPTVAGVSAAGVVPFAIMASILGRGVLHDRLRWMKTREGGVWVALLLLGFSAIFLIVIGRHQLSWLEGYATTSRYHFASLLLMLGSTGVALMMKGRWRIAGWFSAVGLACCHWVATAAAISVYPETQALLAHDRATFAYELAWGKYRGFASTAATLSRRHVYPVLVDEPQDILAKITTSGKSPSLAGEIDSITVNVKSGTRIIHGWSASINPASKPDAIALFQMEPEVKFLGVSATPEHSQPATEYRNQTGRAASGWSASVLSETPKDAIITAYVIDGEQGVVQSSTTWHNK